MMSPYEKAWGGAALCHHMRREEDSIDVTI